MVVDRSLAGGLIEVASIVHPARRGRGQYAPGQRVRQRPETARSSCCAGESAGPVAAATRAVMVLLSVHGLPAAQIAGLLDCHPATVRRWIGRFKPKARPGWPTGPGPAVPGWAAAPGPRDRRAAGAPGPVDPAADLALPGPAAGQRAHAVPAGAAGRGLAAAQADRPRRPGPRPRGRRASWPG